jgi:hypothetical protein
MACHEVMSIPLTSALARAGYLSSLALNLSICTLTWSILTIELENIGVLWVGVVGLLLLWCEQYSMEWNGSYYVVIDVWCLIKIQKLMEYENQTIRTSKVRNVGRFFVFKCFALLACLLAGVRKQTKNLQRTYSELSEWETTSSICIECLLLLSAQGSRHSRVLSQVRIYLFLNSDDACLMSVMFDWFETQPNMNTVHSQVNSEHTHTHTSQNEKLTTKLFTKLISLNMKI